ncbi:hypothetical protein [Oryzibacter oryziterrae]|uniref:hypothetical protein n=1 Tax=Oryzibacter oryziterrae TaxID=2766474 RepID=UPI001F3DD2A1|nr:hypothetical protein [Oryzibacter oryziterrae]
MRPVARLTLFAALLFSQAALAEDFTPPDGEHWVTVASTKDLDTGVGIAKLYGDKARVVSSKSGWYAVTVGPMPGDLKAIADAISWPALPPDAVLSTGKNYVETVWQPSVAEPAQATIEPGKTTTLKDGDLSVTFKRSPMKDEFNWTATLDIASAGKKIGHLTYDIQDVGDMESSVGIVELDTSNPYPEIVFDAFTGGAHCCIRTFVATSRGSDGWEVVDLGELDGGGPTYEDVDGDGAAEMISVDNSFLYAFESYAGSFAPIRIGKLKGTDVVDVTREPAFKGRLKQDVAAMEFQAKLDDSLWSSNGFLAAWVAAKVRIGDGADAWNWAMQHYQKDNGFGISTCSEPVPDDQCPEGKMIELSFPKGLRKQIEEQGYGPLPDGLSDG